MCNYLYIQIKRVLFANWFIVFPSIRSKSPSSLDGSPALYIDWKLSKYIIWLQLYFALSTTKNLIENASVNFKMLYLEPAMQVPCQHTPIRLSPISEGGLHWPSSLSCCHCKSDNVNVQGSVWLSLPPFTGLLLIQT